MSYKDSNCTPGNTEDPINIIWYGRRQVQNDIEPNAVVGYMNASPFSCTNHDGGDSYISGRSTSSSPQVCRSERAEARDAITPMSSGATPRSSDNAMAAMSPATVMPCGYT